MERAVVTSPNCTAWFAALLLLLPGGIMTVEPLTPTDCPQLAVCPICPERPAFSAAANLRMLAACMVGPRRTLIGESPDKAFRWSFRPVDRTQLCSIFDADGDWDVDLRDVAAVLSAGTGSVVVATVADCRHRCTLESYAEIQRCLSGPGAPYVNQECAEFEDFEDQPPDGDIDLDDLSAFFLGARP